MLCPSGVILICLIFLHLGLEGAPNHNAINRSLFVTTGEVAPMSSTLSERVNKFWEVSCFIITIFFFGCYMHKRILKLYIICIKEYLSCITKGWVICIIWDVVIFWILHFLSYFSYPALIYDMGCSYPLGFTFFLIFFPPPTLRFLILCIVISGLSVTFIICQNIIDHSYMKVINNHHAM